MTHDTQITHDTRTIYGTYATHDTNDRCVYAKPGAEGLTLLTHDKAHDTNMAHDTQIGRMTHK